MCGDARLWKNEPIRGFGMIAVKIDESKFGKRKLNRDDKLVEGRQVGVWCKSKRAK